VGIWNGRVGTSSRSDLDMTVAATERTVTGGGLEGWNAFAPKVQELTFEFMNEWQDECFHKGHDDRLY